MLTVHLFQQHKKIGKTPGNGMRHAGHKAWPHPRSTMTSPDKLTRVRSHQGSSSAHTAHIRLILAQTSQGTRGHTLASDPSSATCAGRDSMGKAIYGDTSGQCMTSRGPTNVRSADSTLPWAQTWLITGKMCTSKTAHSCVRIVGMDSLTKTI